MSPGYPLGDLIAGIFGSLSVMMALYHRDLRGGEGQVIDLALYEAVFRFLDFDPIQYDQMKTVHMRTGNRVAYVAPSSMFKTKDGKYLTLAASTQSVWLRLAKAIDSEELTTDPKFIDNPARVVHSAEIKHRRRVDRASHRDQVIEHFDKRSGLFVRVRYGRRVSRCAVPGARGDGPRARPGPRRGDRAKRRAQVFRDARLGDFSAP
jgi:crotonobetainyl-CoA:carnitine CoA-transferase CaiB-like acyl-CoA transferase